MKKIWYYLVLGVAVVIASVYVIWKGRSLWQAAFKATHNPTPPLPGLDPDVAETLYQREYLEAADKAREISSIMAQEKRDALIESIQRRLHALKEPS